MLNHARGFNLRNQLSHGIIHYDGPLAAALVIHTLLMVTLITPLEPDRTGNNDGTSPDDGTTHLDVVDS